MTSTYQLKKSKAARMKETAVLISIRKRWSRRILSGEKTVEARKTYPHGLHTPFRVFQYETAEDGGAGAVVGEWTCGMICCVVSHPRVFAGHTLLHENAILRAGLTMDAAEEYSGGKDVVGWCVQDLIVYDEPRPLSDFGRKRPPQSWCYVVVDAEEKGGNG